MASDPWAEIEAKPAPGVDPWASIIATPAAPEKTTRTDAFGRHFLQGSTANFSDEVLGAIASTLGPAAFDSFPDLKARWESILKGGGGGMPGDSARPEGYKETRDAFRALNSKAMEDQPGASFAGGLTGAIAATRKLPTGYGSAGLQGVVSGLGASEKEDAGGMAQDSAIGGALGLAGNAVGNAVGKGFGWLRGRVLARAQQGIQSAEELAAAQAAAAADKNLGSLRGAAGGAASRASNAISNIEDIPLPETTARTMGALKEQMRAQLAILREKIASARAQAIANGVNPDDLAGQRSGEFLSKGSKLDKAQKAAAKVKTYEDAAQRLEGYLDDIALADDAAPSIDIWGDLRAAREKLRSDPAYIDGQANILKNALEDAPQAIDEAGAARVAYKQALEDKAAEVARRKEALLSPKSATARLKHLALRYGLPAVGGYLGAEMGGVSGAAVGAAAGAGMRPGLQAVRRTLQTDPAVQRRLWSAVGDAADLGGLAGYMDGAELGRAVSTVGMAPATKRLAQLLWLEEPDPDAQQQALINALQRGGTP